jgi:ABC-type lipoprotein release transport system permease subunit
MRAALDKLALLGQLAVRNLIDSRWKTAMIISIVALGAFMVVVGSAFFAGVDRAMRRSITGSVAGHIQVYSRDSRDALELMIGLDMDVPDITPLEDFAAVRDAVSAVPNVQAVVPMAVGNAVVGSSNSVDRALSGLRTLVNERVAGAGSAALDRRYEAQKELVRQVLRVLGHHFESADNVERVGAVADADRALMVRAQTEPFWSAFDADPYSQLELLENHVAPLAADGDPLLLRYLATDPGRFSQAFDRMHAVEGQVIPPGERGFMFSKYVYEEQIKLRAARGLDKLLQARDLRGERIAREPELQRIVGENIVAAREILLQLDPIESERVRELLQAHLHSSENQVGRLLEQFFETNDDNLEQRHAYFYRELAPLLQIYRIGVGDTLTIQAVSRSGYVRSVAVRVYGTFGFTGLEGSPHAGSLNMLDLVTFRELYGFATAEHAQEIETMRAAAGARELPRDRAEATLFGTLQAGTDTLPIHDDTGMALTSLERPAGLSTAHRARTAERYDPAQLERGTVLNAAILVKDEDRLPETMAAIERAGAAAGLPLKAVSWQTAVGPTGQFTALMRAVLYAAVLITFLVGLVIINNALVMTTLERVSEIGVLRALGAQRSTVLAMLLLESALVSLTAGALGTALGALLLAYLHRTGIPAAHEALTFFFSGPRLYPLFGESQLGVALGLVLFVSVASGFYPAWLAMHVSPRQAMQSQD